MRRSLGSWMSQSSEVKAKDENREIREYHEPEFLEKINNRIYFYSEIDRDKVLQLNKSLRELNGELAVKQNEFSLPAVPPIYLHLNSYGGSIFAGLSVMDEILKSKVPVHTIIDGCCASAATFISVVGAKRYINRHAFCMVHQLSGGMWGTFSEMEDQKQNVDRFMAMIKDIYKQYTKVPMKELNEILKHDLWWDAEMCLRYGLVDQIL